MEFLISDTFTDSLTRLTSQEQKAVKTTAFDMQVNPAHPSLQFHRIDKSKDPNFWSLRVSSDIRIIVHKTDASLMLCYVDHHDAAYIWATRRKIERHPRTGAAQLVEIRERVEELVTVVPIPHDTVAPPRPRLFAAISDDALLGYGVPAEWLNDVRNATENSLFDVVEHLPQEAAEALLELATGGTPYVAAPAPADSDPFQHPDALRRFRVLQNVEELERALEYPWEKWSVFLHPAQRHLIERAYGGPARISGSAGTGKTIVALHRAVFLARENPQATVVLLTFSDALANALNHKLMRLVGNEPDVRERIQIYATREFAADLYSASFGQPKLIAPEQLTTLIVQAAQQAAGARFGNAFLLEEWNEIVDAWQIERWEQYRDVPRLGRKTRVGGKQRETLWAIFQEVQHLLAEQQLLTWPMLLRRTAESLVQRGEKPFDFAIVDEAQDLKVAELRFLANLSAGQPDALFFTGDLGQRIFQQPFPWRVLGVDIRGRSHTLTINYRTSHQIREQADRLLPTTIADVDGNAEQRRGTISIFNGPAPQIRTFPTITAETGAVGAWLAERLAEGIQPAEIGVFVRSAEQLPRALEAIRHAGATPAQLDTQVLPGAGSIAASTMHLAKGLEFRAVAVIACDDEVIPLQARIESVTDESDLAEVYTTERHLLYVACTRARDHLLVSGVEPASEFLDDLAAPRGRSQS